MNYEALKGRLERPRPILVWASPVEVEEWFTPHEPPTDREWPTPTTELAIGELMRRLPHVPRVVCALTATELALPVWERWAAHHGDCLHRPSEIEVPAAMLELVRKWLRGEKPILDTVRMPIFRWSNDDEVRRAVAVAESAMHAVYATNAHTDRHSGATANVVYLALNALAVTHGKARRHVYRQWWNRCRCRLPIHDILWAHF